MKNKLEKIFNVISMFILCAMMLILLVSGIVLTKGKVETERCSKIVVDNNFIVVPNDNYEIGENNTVVMSRGGTIVLKFKN